MRRKDGSSYEGTFVNGKRDGIGTISLKNGDRFTANWKQDTIVGKAVYSNGDEYDGEWENHQRNGSGKMKYANGNIYTGGWYKDSQHGEGTFYEHCTGTTTKGNFS